MGKISKEEKKAAKKAAKLELKAAEERKAARAGEEEVPPTKAELKALKKAEKKAAKKAESEKNDIQSTVGCGCGDDCGNSVTAGENEISEIPIFDGNNLAFNKIKAALPAVPHGSDPAFQDHLFNTPIGQLRVRINQDTEAGKAGRRNTQLDGKQIIASVLKTQLDGSVTPSTKKTKDPRPDDGDNQTAADANKELYTATYKKKDFKGQLDLMDVDYTKEQLKDLPKVVTGLQITKFMTVTLACSPKIANVALESLSR